MEFDSLDGYLLDGVPAKSELVERLKALPARGRAAPFLEGLRLLGDRTPDLALIALRIVLAGGSADDAAVSAVRDALARVRAGDAAARDDYHAAVRPVPQS